MDIDATILFRTHSSFWTVINSSMNMSDAISQGLMRSQGSAAALDMMWKSVLQFSGGALSNTGAASTQSADNPHPQKQLATTNALSATVSSPNPHDYDSSPPLKSGWLLKKRDILNGWRSRYFVVYPGRLEYFIDQHDTMPRGVVPLLGAEVFVAKRCTVNGVSDHWGVMYVSIYIYTYYITLFQAITSSKCIC